jgi:hypothetical protein
MPDSFELHYTAEAYIQLPHEEEYRHNNRERHDSLPVCGGGEQCFTA